MNYYSERIYKQAKSIFMEYKMKYNLQIISKLLVFFERVINNLDVNFEIILLILIKYLIIL
jgi:hypothetical protein